MSSNAFQHKGWSFETVKGPEVGDIEKVKMMTSWGSPTVPLPKHVYKDSRIIAKFDSIGISFTLSSESCLKRWFGIQQEESKATGVKLSPKTYDATYQQDYSGAIDVDRAKVNQSLKAAKLIEDSPAIGTRLETKVPIPKDKIPSGGAPLFSDSVDLFSDDLHEFGICSCTAAIRVLDKLFYILYRYYLKVEKERVVVRDVLFVHEFGHQCMYEEIQVYEATMEDLEEWAYKKSLYVQALTGKPPTPLEDLTDPETVMDLCDPHSKETMAIAVDLRRNYVY